MIISVSYHTCTQQKEDSKKKKKQKKAKDASIKQRKTSKCIIVLIK